MAARRVTTKSETGFAMCLRWFCNGLALLGLVLIVALIGAWTTSTSTNSMYVIAGTGPWNLPTCNGAIIARKKSQIKPMPPRSPDEPGRFGYVLIDTPGPSVAQCLLPRRFSTVSTDPLLGSVALFETVIIPLWIPIALVFAASAAPLWRLSRRIRSRFRAARTPTGHCIECNYNLTGNESGKCPECGALVETLSVAPANGVPYDGTIEEHE